MPISDDVTDAVLAAFFVGLATPIALGPALVPSVTADYVEGVFAGGWLVMLVVWALFALGTASEHEGDEEDRPPQQVDDL